ncbi:MAG TPA: hypothetical protein VJI12_02095 [archaeon]|nr:hypothetical protein [archaeon]
MTKGFARIFEAIIASIVIIASLTFFFALTPLESGWGSTSLQIISQDALQAAYLNGTIERYVQTDDKQSLNNDIGQLLPGTVDFSINVRGIPNDIIRVACVDCSSAAMNEFALILNGTEFKYNGRPISIRPETIDLASNDIKDGTNVLFFFDKTKIQTYRVKEEAFIRGGGSVFLLSNLNQTDVTGYMGGIFNLTWAGAASQNAVFYGTTENVSHFVAKYYANITSRNLGDIADTFTVFGSNGVANDRKTVIVGVDGIRSYVRANYEVNRTTGRAVWFSDYTRSDHSNANTAAIDRLLKATLMWASGESYSMDTAKKVAAPQHFTSEIEIFDKDSYIFEITVWRIFF